ncbi:hypothetical protein BT63DRAFT_368388 [Microthyrium microscopicum]|uniref:AMP-dependent synthetase/ligase domain-containing protein n=1 Tax=Microthyrium microscopicum TaxID=703497 RepID=A0A6A6UMQ8_9PEZI|nr:hypothetical protein BT63DRAFT_368388 [Microthyrium microscopicum]
MANIFEQADDALASLFSQWDIYTIILTLTITGFVAHSFLTATEPDIHPMILSRQSYADRVRNPGESAVYRSMDAPHGTSLRTGLAVRLPTDKPYSAGRDGDLRYIWMAATGKIQPPKSRATTQAEFKPGKITTVLGREQLVDHNIQETDKEVMVLGNHLTHQGRKRVAVYLPNSIEFLSSIFACSFYGLSVILIPFNQPQPLVIEFLKQTKADALIAAAGSLPLESLAKEYPALKAVVWVVEKTSRHMDWTDVPSGLGGSIDVAVWHELVQDHQGDAPSDPGLETKDLGSIVTIWQPEPLKPGSVVEFTHRNFAAAIAALIAALPSRERINGSDLFFAADAWTNTYTLCQTFAAMWSGASLAISSVAGPEVDLTFAAKNIAPTVVVSSSESIAKLHAAASSTVQSGLAKLSHSSQVSSLSAGTMPAASFLSNISGATKASIGSTPGTLRLLLISEEAGSTSPPISARELNDIRIFTGARVVYALTAAPVAGAVAQTNMFDYRVDDSTSTRSHFGPPVSSLEVKLVDSGSHKTTNDSIAGEIVVTGPSVVDSSARLGVMGTFRDDCTLAFA